MSKITVKETIQKLQEKNVKPRKIFNKAELTAIVQAIMCDSEYVTKNTKIKQGQFVNDDHSFTAEFKKALADILKQFGLNSKEAAGVIEDYHIPKSFAGAMVDIVHHADHLYMNDIGKGIRFIGPSDTIQTFFARTVDDREHRIPDIKKDGVGAHSKVRISGHKRISVKTKVNPTLKMLLS